MPIDLWSYPHILDRILDSASDAALVALRSTHRSMRDYIDHRMFRRMGYVHWDERLFPGEEFTEPSLKISKAASKVRTLDIYSKGSLRWDPETDLCDSDSDDGCYYLPDDPEYYDSGALKDLDLSPLAYVRYFGVDMKDVFPVTCDPPHTVIQLVQPWKFELVKVNSVRVFWSPEQRIGTLDRVVVFLPEADDSKIIKFDIDDPKDAGDREKVERILCSFGLMIEALLPWKGQPDPAGTVTVVGCELCIPYIPLLQLHVRRSPRYETGLDYIRGYIAEFCLGKNGSTQDIRFLTIDEWRNEISDYEWQLVASLPDARKFGRSCIF